MENNNINEDEKRFEYVVKNAMKDLLPEIMSKQAFNILVSGKYDVDVEKPSKDVVSKIIEKYQKEYDDGKEKD